MDAVDAAWVVDLAPAPDGAADVPLDAAADSSPDVPPDGADGGVARARIFLATTAIQGYGSSDIVAIDVAQGRAVRDVSMGGAIAKAVRNGSLLVVRGGGYTRISVLDPDTLVVTRTQIRPFDPVAAVISADGRYLYATHDEGWVSQVRVADGVVAAEVQVPQPPGGMASTALANLAINRAETLLGATAFHNGDGSSVAVVEIGAGVLTVVDNWLAPEYPNCGGVVGQPVFDVAGTKLATFDNDCSAFDVYDLATKVIDTNASVIFPRADGSSSYVNAVVDARGQFWAANYSSLYRTSTSTPNGALSVELGSTPGPLLTDPTGEMVYVVQTDPRTNGIFTVDLATGSLTRLDWNLDLVELGALVVTATYAAP